MADTNQLTQTLEGDPPSIIARFEFEEARYPFFLSVSSLFADLGFAHDLGVLLLYPEYKGFRFTSRFWIRSGRPLAPEHRLRTVAIEKHSPLVLEIAASVIGGLLTLVQIAEKVRDWKLNKEKLELEVIKLRQENTLREFDIIQKGFTLQETIRERNAERIYQPLIERLSESEFKLRDLGIHSTRY